MTFKVKGDQETIETTSRPRSPPSPSLQKSHPELRVEQFGDASVNKALTETEGEDFKRAETLSLPITLLILAIAFGAIVAAGIPVLLALSAVAGTMGLVNIVSHVVPMSDGVSSVILLVGLAVGVDYSMFYLRREREERAKGRSPREALEVAAATSGRAVLISGITVMIAMAGHVLRRRQHVRLVRHRHDPGRRRRDDRLADRPPRRARRHSATRSRRAASRSSHASSRRTASPASGAPSINRTMRRPKLAAVAVRPACWWR